MSQTVFRFYVYYISNRWIVSFCIGDTESEMYSTSMETANKWKHRWDEGQCEYAIQCINNSSSYSHFSTLKGVIHTQKLDLVLLQVKGVNHASELTDRTH